jgi:hypothetical protein
MQSRCILGLVLLLFAVVYRPSEPKCLSRAGINDQRLNVVLEQQMVILKLMVLELGVGGRVLARTLLWTNSMLNCMHQLPNLKMP